LFIQIFAFDATLLFTLSFPSPHNMATQLYICSTLLHAPHMYQLTQSDTGTLLGIVYDTLRRECHFQ